MPERVREALGNEVSRDLEGWLEGLLVADYVQHKEFAETRDGLARVEVQLVAVDKRLDAVEKRLDGVEKRLDVVDMRLTNLEHGLAELKTEFYEFRREVTERFDRLISEMNQRFDRQNAEMLTFSNSVNERLDRQYQQMLVQTRWNVGLIGLFGTIFAVLYGIGQLKP